MKDISLEQLKIVHNSQFIVVSKMSESGNIDTCNDNLIHQDIDLDKLDKQLGHEFEPVSLKILFGEHDRNIRVFANLKFDEFKSYLANLFNINSDFNIIFKNNNKNTSLDKIAFDRKNNIFLTLKQLKVGEKNILFIQRVSSSENNANAENNANNTNENNNLLTTDELKEKITLLVKIEEDDENIQVISN